MFIKSTDAVSERKRFSALFYFSDVSFFYHSVTNVFFLFDIEKNCLNLVLKA